MKKTISTTTTAVSVVNNNDVLGYFGKIQERLKELDSFEKKEYLTHGQFRWNPAYTGNAAINIITSTCLEDLLNIYASIKEKMRAYDEAASDNDLREYPDFMWQGCAGKNWLHDLSLRISILTNNVESKKKQLLEVQKELSSLMTKDDYLTLLTQKIDNLL